MATLKKNGKTVRLIPEQKIEIVKLLADGMTRKEISEKYHTSEKEISRARDLVLTFSPKWRNEQTARVQKYLVICEEKKIKRAMRKKIASENDTKSVVVTNESQLEEKSSKANIYAQSLNDHYKDLSTAAWRIVELIHFAGSDSGKYTISQIVNDLSKQRDGQDRTPERIEQYEELSELLINTEAKWLLSHIKYEAPELFVHIMYAHPKFFKSEPYKKPKSKNIGRWEDMTQDDVYEYGEQLTDLLKKRAGRLDFKGTCEFCDGRK
jgi:hypothetical protein